MIIKKKKKDYLEKIIIYWIQLYFQRNFIKRNKNNQFFGQIANGFQNSIKMPMNSVY